MKRYKCSAYGANQFSADEKAEKEPCIMCGHPETELQADLEDPEGITAIAESMESGGDI